MEARARVVRRRLRDLDHRIDGPRALTARTQAVPAAYRAFARQVGLDPDADADALTGLLTARILRGTFPSAGAVQDACAMALVETGVPVWAVDGQEVVQPLRIELAEDLSLVVREADRLVAPLLQPPLPELVPTRNTRVARLYAIVVGGVPRATVEEALWVAERALAS